MITIGALCEKGMPKSAITQISVPMTFISGDPIYERLHKFPLNAQKCLIRLLLDDTHINKNQWHFNPLYRLKLSNWIICRVVELQFSDDISSIQIDPIVQASSCDDTIFFFFCFCCCCCYCCLCEYLSKPIEYLSHICNSQLHHPQNHCNVGIKIGIKQMKWKYSKHIFPFCRRSYGRFFRRLVFPLSHRFMHGTFAIANLQYGKYHKTIFRFWYLCNFNMSVGLSSVLLLYFASS